jgi:hypothetical protein
VLVGELEAASSRPGAGKSYQELVQAARLVEVEATEQVETELEVRVIAEAEACQRPAIELISFKTLVLWGLRAKLD